MLDFDTLLHLSQSNPEEFERQVSMMIKEEIKKMADGDAELEHRLRCQQWAIESRLDLCSNPTARYLKIQQMLAEQFNILRDKLNGL